MNHHYVNLVLNCSLCWDLFEFEVFLQFLVVLYLWKVKKEKMFAVFKNGVVDPPQELNSPASVKAKANHPGEVLKDFLSSHSGNAFSIGFADNAIMAYTPHNHSLHALPR